MKEIVIAAVVALGLGGQQAGAPQQPQQQAKAALPDAPSQQPQQSAQIPDAPKPQTTGLGIGPVTPGKGTTPTSNGESGSSAPDPDQPEIGATLPSSVKAPPDNDPDPTPPVSSEGAIPTLYARTNLVEVPFTVKDSKGHLVPGLTYHDVHVYENNVRQHMLVFTVDPHPLSVAVVIDQSLGFHDMEKVNNALGALQGAFTPYDEVAVITYNNGPKMITNFTAGQSNRLTAAIERSKAPGREQMYYAPGEGLGGGGININNGAEANENPLTSRGPASPGGVGPSQVPRDVHTLNDALFMAAQATAKAGKGRRRIVYVISDGKEYGSSIKTKDVIKYMQRNNVEVCATLVGDSSVSGMGFIDTLHLPMMMRDNILPVYTKATGGLFYADYRQKSIEASFAQITEDVRTQYTAWFSSREPMIDGKFRKLEVRVLRPNLQVIAKDGYYPSAQDQNRPTEPTTTPPASTPPLVPRQ